MPHYAETAPGNLIARIDNVSGSGTRRFLVDHDGGAPGTELFEVSENGNIQLHGKLHRDAAIQINNNQSGDIVQFQTGGAVKCSIDANGRGDFSAGGLNLRILSSTSESGNDGDLALMENGSFDYKLYTYVATSAPPWVQVWHS